MFPLYQESLPTSNRAGPSAQKPHASPAQRSLSQVASRGRNAGGKRRKVGRWGSCYLLGAPPLGGPGFKVSPGVAQGSPCRDRDCTAWLCCDLVFPIPSGMGEKTQGLWESEGRLRVVPRGLPAGSTSTLSKVRDHREWKSELESGEASVLGR